MYGQIGGQVDGQIEGQANGWADWKACEWMDRLDGRRMDEWMNILGLFSNRQEVDKYLDSKFNYKWKILQLIICPSCSY